LPSKKSRQRAEEKRTAELKEILSYEKYSDRDVTAIGNVLIGGLDNNQWREIVRYARFPNKLRPIINGLIKTYWDVKLHDRMNAKTHSNIAGARRLTEQLKDAVKQISTDRYFFSGIMPYYDKSPHDQRELLEDTFAALNRFDSLMLDAQARYTKPVGRPSYTPVEELVRALDAVFLMHMGIDLKPDKRNSSKEKKAIARIIKSADPIVPDIAIDSVLRRYLKAKSKWGSDAGLALHP
jgi:hypothetical protein